jgi:hypothetical protein
MKKQWLKDSLTFNHKIFHLYDFSDEKWVAEKLKREALDEGVLSAKIVERKNAYFEKYPSGEGYMQKVYAVYVFESVGNDGD